MNNSDERDHVEPDDATPPVDWRRTIKFFLILTSPVIVLALYMLGVKLLTVVAFGNYGE